MDERRAQAGGDSCAIAKLIVLAGRSLRPKPRSSLRRSVTVGGAPAEIVTSSISTLILSAVSHARAVPVDGPGVPGVPGDPGGPAVPGGPAGPAGPVELSQAKRMALASMMIEILVVRPNERVMVIPLL